MPAAAGVAFEPRKTRLQAGSAAAAGAISAAAIQVFANPDCPRRAKDRRRCGLVLVKETLGLGGGPAIPGTRSPIERRRFEQLDERNSAHCRQPSEMFSSFSVNSYFVLEVFVLGSKDGMLESISQAN